MDYDNNQEKNICDGTNHHVKIDFVTFIEHPDEVWRKWATGTVDKIVQEIKNYRDSKAPNVDMFIDYCCEACKEANHE
jgi:hypothetical protein